MRTLWLLLLPALAFAQGTTRSAPDDSVRFTFEDGRVVVEIPCSGERLDGEGREIGGLKPGEVRQTPKGASVWSVNGPTDVRASCPAK